MRTQCMAVDLPSISGVGSQLILVKPHLPSDGKGEIHPDEGRTSAQTGLLTKT